MQKKQEIVDRITTLEDEVKKVVRRLDDQSKQLDSIDSDRQILEDILGRLSSLEEQTKKTRSNDIETKKQIKEEISDVADRVEYTIKDTLGKRKIIHSKEKKSWWEKLIGW